MKRAELEVGEVYVDSYGSQHVMIAYGYEYGYHRRDLRKGGKMALVLRRSWDRQNVVALADAKRFAVALADKLDGMTNPSFDKLKAPSGWVLEVVGLTGLKETLSVYEDRKAREHAAREEREATERRRHNKAAAQQALFVASLESLGIPAAVRVDASSTSDILTVKIDAEAFSALLRRAT